MHQASSLSPDNVLRFLQVTGAGASLDAIQRGLHLRKSDRRPLAKMLAKLKKRKAIVELPGGRFTLASRRTSPHSPADAASRPDHPREARGTNQSAGQDPPTIRRNSFPGRLILHPDG